MDNLPCHRKIYRLNNFVGNRISTDRKVSKTGNWANPPLRALLISQKHHQFEFGLFQNPRLPESFAGGRRGYGTNLIKTENLTALPEAGVLPETAECRPGNTPQGGFSIC